MQMVIDIPETMIDWLKNGYPNEDDMDKLIEMVLSGTPLPKGHGGLVDMSEVLSELLRLIEVGASCFNHHCVGYE